MTVLCRRFACLSISTFCVLSTGLAARQQQNVKTGIISGVVVDERGIPVSDAEVDAQDAAGPTVSKALRLALTDSSGAFAFDPITFGTYKFYALKPESGYPDTKFEIYADSYHKTAATISAASPSAFVTIVVGPKAGVVRLTVLDRATHEAVPNPTLILRRPDTNVWVSAGQTNDSRILVPPAVPTELTVQAKGYSSWSNYDSDKPESAELIKIDSGREIQMTVELERSGEN